MRTGYRFAVLSDIHIDLENGGTNTYFIHAEKNFRRALSVIAEHGCDFIINAGDTVTNASGAVSEWRRYREILDNSGYRKEVFEAVGNHETRFAKYGGCTVGDCLDEFIRYTRLGEKSVSRPHGKTYYAYTEPVFGDVFLFMSLENGVNTNEIDNFSDEQIRWLEEWLQRCRNEHRRVFLIQHAPIYGFGAGDDTQHPAYEGTIRLSDRDGVPFRNNRRFYELINQYDNVIWLSGHTHVDLRDGVNFALSGCRMIHIPALAGSTRLSTDANGRRTLDRTFYDDAAQGYLADVTADTIVFRGIDFLTGRLYPEYTYTI